jgi:hypothetical protein
MATTVNGKVKVLLINEPHAVGAEHLERLREIMDLTVRNCRGYPVGLPAGR